jgi:hypothetical protein
MHYCDALTAAADPPGRCLRRRPTHCGTDIHLICANRFLTTQYLSFAWQVPGSGRPRAMSTTAQAEVLSGNHHWYASSHARPTYCNVCRDALSGEFNICMEIDEFCVAIITSKSNFDLTYSYGDCLHFHQGYSKWHSHPIILLC